jgi:hypothetical protein
VLKNPSDKKPYLRPEMKKLDSEQAVLILVGLAWAGDTNARELLEILVPIHGKSCAA